MAESKYFEDNVRHGRDESPRVEQAFQDAVKDALLELLENKGLYQNATINERFSSLIPIQKSYSYLDEFSSRPLMLFSRGDTEAGVKLPGSSGGRDRISTPLFQMEAGCYLPDIETYCAVCKRETGFISHSSSNAHEISPYPIIGKNTEQIYSPLYRCSKCREQLITFQIFRKGMKLQLTGRSSPFRPKLDKDWPSSIEEIVKDAFAAVAENDLAAGYYHLRTALEFCIKKAINIEIEEKIEGTELCSRYYEVLDERLKSNFPSISSIYSELSQGIHTRKCHEDKFNELARKYLDHLKAKALFEKYTPNGTKA